VLVRDLSTREVAVKWIAHLLTWRVRSWGIGLAFDAVTDGQVGVGVAGSGLGELLAEGVEGAAAAGCGGGVKPDVQGVPGDVQVAGEGELLAEQGVGFIVGPESSAGAASGRGWTRRCRRPSPMAWVSRLRSSSSSRASGRTYAHRLSKADRSLLDGDRKT
jgi:hypothetical protein